MMQIWLNGTPVSIRDDATVQDVVESLLASTKGVAVSVDRDVVPRSSWPTTSLPEGSHVEVLAAAAGG